MIDRFISEGSNKSCNFFTGLLEGLISPSSLRIRLRKGAYKQISNNTLSFLLLLEKVRLRAVNILYVEK